MWKPAVVLTLTLALGCSDNPVTPDATTPEEGVLSAGVRSAGGGVTLDDGNTIHACAKNQGGGLRLVDSSDDCLASETLVEWNVQGPQGPPGTAFVHVHTAEETSDDPFFAVGAFCEAGEVALGGGYNMAGPALSGAEVRDDRPTIPNALNAPGDGETPGGWAVFVNKVGPIASELDLTLRVWVLCAPTSSELR
jgi:hypothetical protein